MKRWENAGLPSEASATAFDSKRSPSLDIMEVKACVLFTFSSRKITRGTGTTVESNCATMLCPGLTKESLELFIYTTCSSQLTNAFDPAFFLTPLGTNSRLLGSPLICSARTSIVLSAGLCSSVDISLVGKGSGPGSLSVVFFGEDDFGV